MWQYYAAISATCFIAAFGLAFLGNQKYVTNINYRRPFNLQISIGVRKWA